MSIDPIQSAEDGVNGAVEEGVRKVVSRYVLTFAATVLRTPRSRLGDEAESVASQHGERARTWIEKVRKITANPLFESHTRGTTEKWLRTSIGFVCALTVAFSSALHLEVPIAHQAFKALTHEFAPTPPPQPSNLIDWCLTVRPNALGSRLIQVASLRRDARLYEVVECERYTPVQHMGRVFSAEIDKHRGQQLQTLTPLVAPARADLLRLDIAAKLAELLAMAQSGNEAQAYELLRFMRDSDDFAGYRPVADRLGSLYETARMHAACRSGVPLHRDPCPGNLSAGGHPSRGKIQRAARA